MKRDRNEAGSGPSQRQLRVGELVRHAMAEIVSRGDLIDDLLARVFITFPEVRMSPDLKIATIFVTVHDAKDEQPVIKALASHRGEIRREVARRVNLKFAPDVRFRIDDRLDDAARIDAILRSPEVQRDIRKPHDHDDEDAE